MPKPQIPIDAEEVQKLAQYGMRNFEIADFFNCSKDTIERRFADEIKAGRAAMHKSLRIKQFQVAMGGNVSMLIWLGKQELGQMDKAVLELSKVPQDVFLEEAKRRLALEEKKDE